MLNTEVESSKMSLSTKTSSMHILKFLASKLKPLALTLASKLKSLASKPTSPRKCSALDSERKEFVLR